MDKREFIKTVGAASLCTFINPIDALGFNLLNTQNKKVLILGGRGFLGPSIVEAFLTSGYQVTLLNRGRTNPHLFKNLPTRIGMLLLTHGKSLQNQLQISLTSLKVVLDIITIYLRSLFMINGIKNLL